MGAVCAAETHSVEVEYHVQRMAEADFLVNSLSDTSSNSSKASVGSAASIEEILQLGSMRSPCDWDTATAEPLPEDERLLKESNERMKGALIRLARAESQRP
eukprot:gnl/TRDRNA2_/TRDRNA2_174019_c0_seq8.p1 gnl/TRDRNA2_/TRDRNA2_174019_c0~~gnl/TRDRNA2_/TRDRNA2_174019_c0_seq8.p1  ORF type:complete len:102 (-),score=18.58 gnl/TRDRNA2_/TRDRNA2_174019_c0_seq8:61-366(-)